MTRRNLNLFLTTARGVRVLFDDKDSHLATHLKDTPGLSDLVREIFDKFDIKLRVGEPRVTLSYDFGRIIGKSGLVKTDASSEIVYAKRKNRNTFSRFAKNREAEDISIVSVILTRLDHNEIELFSAWIGPIVPSFPNDGHDEPESKEFWNNHALIWGDQEVQEDTTTTVCPW